MISLGENTNFLPHSKLDFSEATNFTETVASYVATTLAYSKILE